MKTLILGKGFLGKKLKEMMPEAKLESSDYDSSMEHWDVIIYTTFITDVNLLEKLPKNAFEVCIEKLTSHVRHGDFFIYISSVFASDERSVYGKLKRASELIVETRKEDYFIIRTDDLWDFEKHPEYTHGYTDVMCNPTFANELAFAIKRVIEMKHTSYLKHGQLLQIAVGEKMSKYEFGKLFNPNIKPVSYTVSEETFIRLAHPRNYVSHFEKETSDRWWAKLGVKFSSAEEIIKEKK